jgi:GDSL-like Lipase/Acylhydrolase family
MQWTRNDEEGDSLSAASAPGGGRVRRACREVFLQLLIVVATLAAIEVFLRVIDLRELREGYGRGYTVVHRYDPELGWLPIPNTVAAFTGSRTISLQHNSLGLRDVEHERTDRPTVLFVGDSFVWGFDVEAGERFTELLRADLPGMEIVNAGVNGYGTDQEYLLLNRIWSAFRPDVVVLNFTTSNDRDDNTSNMISDGYYKPYLARAADGTWRFFGQPVPKSRQTYFTDDPLVKNLWLARLAVTSYIYVRHPQIAVPDPTEQLVGMMRDLVESKGAKFLVGLQYADAKLELFLQAQEIRYTSFDGAEPYPANGNHWTPKGHALVADRLKALLSATGIVKSSSALPPDRGNKRQETP